MKKINYITLLMLILIVASCKPTYEKEYSWAYPVAGDWTVKTYVAGVETSDYYEIKSYNSAFGKDSIIIDDYGIGVAKSSEYGNLWTMRCKAAVDMNSKTFQSAISINLIPNYEIGIKIANGKVIGKDSIYFEVQFEDDTAPFGTTYQIAGHRTTSYEEYMQ